ncbi:hypothetical protein J4480_02650 [Candidatus Woesearchaeota archaeon]|nr:hypothetical protein [Candidatus Woesearchaeota archaeon]
MTMIESIKKLLSRNKSKVPQWEFSKKLGILEEDLRIRGYLKEKVNYIKLFLRDFNSSKGKGELEETREYVLKIKIGIDKQFEVIGDIKKKLLELGNKARSKKFKLSLQKLEKILTNSNIVLNKQLKLIGECIGEDIGIFHYRISELNGYLTEEKDLFSQEISLEADMVNLMRMHQQSLAKNKILMEIAKGNGLEVINKIGWKNFRSALIQMSYAGIIEEQTRQILELRKDIYTYDYIQSLPNDGRDRLIKQIIKRNRTEYDAVGSLINRGIHKDQVFYSTIAQGKFVVIGYNSVFFKLESQPCTRLYIAPPYFLIRVFFEKLINELSKKVIVDKEGDIFTFIEVALNFSPYPDEVSLYIYNGIIVYVAEILISGEIKSKVMEALADSILKCIGVYKEFGALSFKRAYGAVFDNFYLEQIRETAIIDLLMPLNQNILVGMIEVQHGESYHDEAESIAHEFGFYPYIMSRPYNTFGRKVDVSHLDKISESIRKVDKSKLIRGRLPNIPSLIKTFK